MVWIFQDPPSHPLNIFLVQVFITLAITRILGKLFSYIRMPHVIGEICGGIVLGPSVLGRIPNFSNTIFPQASPSAPASIKIKSVDTFTVAANIGLILFMFLMGLEWDAKQVRKMWRTSAPVALGSIIFPFGLGALFSMWWYEVNNEHQGFEPPNRTAFILFAGTCLSFTAFPVLCSILKATNTSTAPIGQFTLSCAALDDILAWCLLAIASSFAATGNANDGGAVFGLAAAYVIIMIFIIRPLVKYTYRYFKEKGKPVDDSVFICLLFMMLLTSAFTCETIGIHAFFGAFVAGVIIPKEDHLPEHIAPKIELVVRELLLPLFFASSGIKTDIGELNSIRYWGITLAIILIACVAKMLPSFVLCRIVAKQDWRFCTSVAVLMNTRGLVELIALNVALNANILSPLLFTMLVLMAIVTTAMTGPLFHYSWLRYMEETPAIQPTGYSFLSPSLAPVESREEVAGVAETAIPDDTKDTPFVKNPNPETGVVPLASVLSHNNQDDVPAPPPEKSETIFITSSDV